MFALTESSLISDPTFMLRDRENHVRIHKNICRTDIDYSALHALTGVVLESYLLCDSLDSGRVWHKCFVTPVSARSLPGGREFVATGGGDSRGAACLKRAVQDSPEFAALMSNRLFMRSLTTIHDLN